VLIFVTGVLEHLAASIFDVANITAIRRHIR